MHAEALTKFEKLLGDKGFSTDPEAITPWLTDWRGRYTGRAAALLSPATTAELAQIMRIANEYRVPLVPQGGNSGMVAGATPDQSGSEFILSLRRLDWIDPIDVDAQTVRCGAGVILQNLHDAAAASGLRFPLTLGGKGSATVGGLVSTNAGGTQVLRHGTMRQLVAGIEAVLPDGSIFDAMAPLKKDNRGYDLKHLLIGAEGTLGVVTAANLHLTSALIDRAVVWVGVDSPSTAYRLLQFMSSEAQAALEGFEILPRIALEHVLRHIPGTRSPLAGNHGWHVLIELVQDHPSQPTPGALAQSLLAIAAEQGLLEDATISVTEAQAEAFWKIRDSIAEAERAEGPALQHDISVPVDAMATFIERETPLVESAFPGTHVVAFGHLGDGNIHYHVKAPFGVEPMSWYREFSEAISGDVYDRVARYGGSLSAEHGIGQAKLAQFARLSDPARMHALRAIKAALDPAGIMNPGKLVPLASDGIAA